MEAIHSSETSVTTQRHLGVTIQKTMSDIFAVVRTPNFTLSLFQNCVAAHQGGGDTMSTHIHLYTGDVAKKNAHARNMR
jgi:hypothetical protein